MKRGFAGLHPIVQIIYYVGIMGLCMFMKHPIYLLVPVLALIADIAVLGGVSRLKENFLLYFITFAALAVLTPLTSHRGANVIFYLAGNPITWEAFIYGISSGLATCALLLICTLLNMTLDADGILFAFSKYLPNLTIMLLLALRFVPHFKIRLREISEIWSTRPVKKNKITKAMQVCNILLVRSLEDAVFTAQSMRTRGYRLTKKRTFYFPYRWNSRNFTMLFVIIWFFIIIGICIAQGMFAAAIYPKLELGNMSVQRVAAAVVLAAFALIPIISGGGQRGTN